MDTYCFDIIGENKTFTVVADVIRHYFEDWLTGRKICNTHLVSFRVIRKKKEREILQNLSNWQIEEVLERIECLDREIEDEYKIDAYQKERAC